MKICPVGSQLFHADGRMDGQTADKQRHNEYTLVFAILCTRLKIGWLVLGYIIRYYKWISLWTEGPQNLRKPSSHLKILENRRVILSKFLIEGPQILGRDMRDFCTPNIEGSHEGMASKFSSSCKSRFSIVCPLLPGVSLQLQHIVWMYVCMYVCMYDDIWKEMGRVINHRDCTNISTILHEFLLQ
jgi:hypothetical protein